MGKSTGKFVDRRGLIGLAAGLACVLPAAHAAESGTRVIVDLGGVVLPDKIAETFEQDIRRAVLMAVAKAAPRTRFKSLPLPEGTLGIVLRRA